jgi:hypothetical protein
VDYSQQGHLGMLTDWLISPMKDAGRPAFHSGIDGQMTKVGLGRIGGQAPCSRRKMKSELNAQRQNCNPIGEPERRVVWSFESTDPS